MKASSCGGSCVPRAPSPSGLGLPALAGPRPPSAPGSQAPRVVSELDTRRSVGPPRPLPPRAAGLPLPAVVSGWAAPRPREASGALGPPRPNLLWRRREGGHAAKCPQNRGPASFGAASSSPAQTWRPPGSTETPLPVAPHARRPGCAPCATARLWSVHGTAGPWATLPAPSQAEPLTSRGHCPVFPTSILRHSSPGRDGYRVRGIGGPVPLDGTTAPRMPTCPAPSPPPGPLPLPFAEGKTKCQPLPNLPKAGWLINPATSEGRASNSGPASCGASSLWGPLSLPLRLPIQAPSRWTGSCVCSSPHLPNASGNTLSVSTEIQSRLAGARRGTFSPVTEGQAARTKQRAGSPQAQTRCGTSSAS